MGQAKLRGTSEQRKKAAIERDKAFMERITKEGKVLPQKFVDSDIVYLYALSQLSRRRIR